MSMEIILFAIVVVAVVVLVVSIAQNSMKESKAARERRKSALTQEELYNGIVKLVESGKYQQACKLWEENKPSGRYTLEYKDLPAQYYYAKALGGYVGEKQVCLAEVNAALERVPEHFRNSDKYREEAAALCSTVRGVYTKKAAAGSEYRVDIDSRGLLSVQLNQPSNYVTVNYIKGGKACWTIEDGVIVAGQVSSGHYFLSMVPMVGGMEVNDARQFGNDPELCGTYARRNDLEPGQVKQTQEGT